MKQAAGCYLRRGREVLLGLKKGGFGAGYFVGIGGQLEGDETAGQAVVREIREEVGAQVAPEDVVCLGSIIFLFPAIREWDLHMTLFQAEHWQGEIIESKEIKPAWFRLDEIPYEQMWEDARYWLPHLLDGIRLQARIIYQADNVTVEEVLLKLT
ncbi:MAG TPA: 8-oxo-dGTP diphosphatase [Levilinea sp.]|nr:8-oxo-dGTP diphosphatase [Levilinea sp.]